VGVKLHQHVGILVTLAASAWAQSATSSAKILKLDVVKDKDATRVEVILSAPGVRPQVTVEVNPDRIILALPDVGPDYPPTSFGGDRDAVTTLQAVFDENSHPPLTRIVIGLSAPGSYELANDGTEIVVTLRPLPAQAKGTKKRQGAAGAASAPLISRIYRKPDESARPTGTAAQNADASWSSSVPPPANSTAPPAADQSGQTPVASVAQPESTVALPAQASGSQRIDNSDAPDVDGKAPVGEVELDQQGFAPQQPNPNLRIAFRVKYIAEGIAYLEGGRNDGLAEGMKLEVKSIDPSEKVTAASSSDAQPIAELNISSAALSSAVGEIQNPTRPVQVGDWAYLSSEDTQTLIAQRSLSATRKYPVVIAFSEGDTLDDEARVVIPRPPLPEINRARGRIGFDYSGVASHDVGGGLSSNAGVMIRTDITRINGTYWNLNGFWRGRINNQSHAGQDTIQDLINRTYTIGLTYDNPNSKWVAGFGRLYLPWATSLDTIDGGYFGRRLSSGVTAGIFAGSSPDPTSWNYDPNRRIGGAFVNFEGGSFDSVRYTSTSGFGLGLLKWDIDRPFVFFENGIFYKRYLSIYHALQADSPSGNPQVAAPGAGVSRSFLTVRLQPASRIEFDLNHTYFRDIPTYNASLVDTGLLDKYLFQGFSGGVRVQVVKDVWAYNLIGRSNRSGDTKASWNQLYGVTVGRMPWIGMRTDVHYSKFDSSFGSGSYTSLSLSRNFNDNLRWEVLGGRQSFASPSTKDLSHFVTGTFEASLGPRYFVQTGYTWNRGAGQNYDQWLFTFGYRFDSRMKGK